LRRISAGQIAKYLANNRLFPKDNPQHLIPEGSLAISSVKALLSTKIRINAAEPYFRVNKDNTQKINISKKKNGAWKKKKFLEL
jgi:hypothetical protein